MIERPILVAACLLMAGINPLLAQGRYREIAEYCLRDVRATRLLYGVWKERLAGIK